MKKCQVWPVGRRRRPIIYMVPIFLVVGFLLELSTYEYLSYDEFRYAIASIPKRWYWKPDYQQSSFNKHPVLNTVYEVTDNKSLQIEGTPLQLWELPTLLNINPFSWIMLNKSMCRPDPNNPENTQILPILVHTARVHFEERVAIRKTWGSLPIYKNWDIRLVFLLGEQDPGTSPEEHQELFEVLQSRLNTEQIIFGDIVIGSFIDSYHNLTYKHLMGYKWVLNFCSNANFILKVDDDMFIDIIKWLDWRTEDNAKLEKNPSAKIPDLYCNTIEWATPMREKSSKWYASNEDWPQKYYPDYCSGWAYAISMDLIKKLYSVSNYIKFYWIDDMFVTGALLEVVKDKFDWSPKVKHIWGETTRDIETYKPMCSSSNWNSKREFQAVVYVSRGKMFEKDMQCMWNKTLHDRTHKSGCDMLRKYIMDGHVWSFLYLLINFLFY